MNKSLRYLAILAIVPLFTAGLGTDYFTDADAIKGKGVGTSKYGSDTGICGLDLCSNFPGGRAAWEADQGSTITPVAPVKEEHMEETHEEEHMEETHEEESKELTEADLGSVLRLSRANVPATIPMHQGFYDGEDVYYIITDSSDPTHADIITEKQGWQVELAPLLKNTPEEALSKVYLFTNGIKGDGIHGYQNQVFTSTPAQADVYSALTSHIHVMWNDGATSRVLTSETAVMDAAENNEITLTEINVVLNMPQIIWPEGQMMVKDVTLTDTTPYGGGQVLDIDTEEMNVTFIAHRGWGPDGRTIYYIVTDATPSGPAGMMGVVSAPTSASLIANSAAVDLYQFKNGLTGTGPLGFQPGIAAGAPGDANYSPMWRIFMIGWDNPENAQVLETIDDMNAYKKAGLIDIGIARPMDSDHIVNCPFIDPFQ
jgi:hypothetical protein